MNEGEETVCRVCSKDFVTQKSLMLHVLATKDDTHPTLQEYKALYAIANKRDRVYSCKKCDRQDMSYSTFLAHLKLPCVSVVTSSPPVIRRHSLTSRPPIKLKFKAAKKAGISPLMGIIEASLHK